MRWIAPYLLLVGACTTARDASAPTHTERPPLHATNISTTAHSRDGAAHLTLHAQSATHPHGTRTLLARAVKATLHTRTTPALFLRTPRALCNGAAGRIYTTAPLGITHPNGVLNARGGAYLDLETQHVVLSGPVFHTITS